MPPHIEPDNCGNYVVQDSTTKNDLGVDCISRADARSLVVKIGTKDILSMSGKAFQDLYKGIDNLPSVTPIRPKGHWEWYRCDMYICSECKNVYTDLSGIKDGMKYCPNCGADMSEV